MWRTARSSPISEQVEDGSRSVSRGASVHNGRVYAVDVQRLMMEAIERRVQREGYTNVTPILGDDDDPRLPADGRTDAVLIVDAFHEMENPVLLLQNVARTLKPQGPNWDHRLPSR